MEIKAQQRQVQGTGASRRLRKAGKTPGIVYGGKDPAMNIEIDHNELFQALRKEAFHASVLSLNVDGKPQSVLLRNFNMHPFRREVQHIDFQRVLADQKIHMKVPLHFMNQEASTAVKLGGAKITHILNEIDIKCLPGDLPEYIEVDLANIEVGNPIHANELTLPKGVELAHGNENPAVVLATVPRAAEEVATEETAAPVASAVPASKQAEPKKEEGKADDKKGGDKKK
ncbi:MAG TPA: 50S ribosomal protein L25/general stress protein Ctc [Burkholderiales bacterium]|nr:50S ribosomal protein L25/general stress protein Ctc [Burkholderiales bacterium]